MTTPRGKAPQTKNTSNGGRPAGAQRHEGSWWEH
jgi:hypothetical protein